MNWFFLKNDEIIVTQEVAEITTVLGSCVSVCLWEEKHKIAAINHILLATPATSSPTRLTAYDSLTSMLTQMEKLGAEKKYIVAKVFGGAASLKWTLFGTGKYNTEEIFRCLKELGIPVVAKEVLGMHSRKITFNTETGIVKVKNISTAALTQ